MRYEIVTDTCWLPMQLEFNFASTFRQRVTTSMQTESDTKAEGARRIKTNVCMQEVNKKVENTYKFAVYILELIPEGCSNSVIATLYVYSD
ncbi:hypothetical protein Ddc_16169 [Ditylenchus destructor]|nr:hypothetical protein Ddc_16169 [Ditylenchus destructor]